MRGGAKGTKHVPFQLTLENVATFVAVIEKKM